MSLGGDSGLSAQQAELQKELAAQKKLEEQQNEELQEKTVQSFKRRATAAGAGSLPFSLINTLGG